MHPAKPMLVLALTVVAISGCGDAAPEEATGATQADALSSVATHVAADTRLEEKSPTENYGSPATSSRATTLYLAGNSNGSCGLSEVAIKFDVSSLAGKTITGARLKLFVTEESTSGQFEMYRLGRDWNESTATWSQFASGSPWAAPGANGSGDRGPMVRGAFTGSHGTGYQLFPLNADGVVIVQEWINQTTTNNGLLLRPTTSSPCTNAADGMAFSSRETANPPELIVDYGTPTPPTTPPPTTPNLKVVTWNVEDGHFQSAGQDFLVKQKPQVAFLQEVDSEALVLQLVKKLQADQGGTFYSKTICRGTDSCASNIAIVSRFPLSSIDQLDLRTYGTYAIPCYSSAARSWPGRRALAATITVNSRKLSVFSVRTSSDNDFECVRNEEVTKLKAWANAHYPEPHVFGGDFNQQPSDASTKIMGADPYPMTDSWAQAVSPGSGITAFATLDSTPDLNTPTRSSRLDYIFYTKGTPYLTVKQVAIVDSSNLSDHRPMETTFEVK